LMSTTTSPAQIDANRQNAQLSCGPKTSEGKAKSALNSVKTGLTGRTVLLPTDDAAAYEQHVQRFLAELKPAGAREHELVQALADNSWRTERIFSLEMGIYARGRMQFAAQFEQEDPAVRLGLIELETFLFYEKQLRNLNIQEARLRRQREKDTAELKQLQKERIQKEQHELEMASKLYLAAKHENKPFDPAEFGFDFSTEYVEDYLKGVRAAEAAIEHMKSPLRAA
ncbi:MAG: hypothetical protein ACRD45_23095, partial [Bryobacteraceae bacterium]